MLRQVLLFAILSVQEDSYDVDCSYESVNDTCVPEEDIAPSESGKKVARLTRESLSFVVYMIHACANKWLKKPADVYALLQKAGCIDNYLVPYYDVLHTQGTDYVVEDIVEYLGIRGVQI